jgi:hypothetical protein
MLKNLADMFRGLFGRRTRRSVAADRRREFLNQFRKGRVEGLEDRSLMAVALGAGDIAFTGYQADAPDTFSFVLLKTVDNTTSLTFTDNGWKGSQDGFNATEQTATVTFNSAYAAGTHFAIVDGGTPQFRLAGTTTSAGSVTGSLNGVSASHDNILSYQGTAPTSGTATNWVAGIIQTPSGWNASYTSGANDWTMAL